MEKFRDTEIHLDKVLLHEKISKKKCESAKFYLGDDGLIPLKLDMTKVFNQIEIQWVFQANTFTFMDISTYENFYSHPMKCKNTLGKSKMSLKFWRYISERTLAQSYDTSNECHLRVKQNFISEIHLRVFLTNILIFEQFNGYSGAATSEV